MNAAVSSPAFHAVPCGEETRSAKPRRSSSRHRSSDAGSTFPVSSASSSMKRERPARCNAKTWAICCEVNTDFPFITDKDGACFTQGKNDMSFVCLGNKRSGLRMNETETRCDKDIPEEYGTPRGKSCHFCIAPHGVVLLHHYSIIPLPIRIGRAALLRSTSCHCICSPCAKEEDGKGNIRGYGARCRRYG